MGSVNPSEREIIEEKTMAIYFERQKHEEGIEVSSGQRRWSVDEITNPLSPISIPFRTFTELKTLVSLHSQIGTENLNDDEVTM